MPGEERNEPGQPVIYTPSVTGTVGGGEDNRLPEFSHGIAMAYLVSSPRLPAPAVSHGRLLALRSAGPTC